MQKNFYHYGLYQREDLYREIIEKFRLDIKELQNSVINDLCDSKYIPQHFSKIILKKVEDVYDYAEVDCIICDYHNMVACLFNKYNETNSVPMIRYVKPTFDDGYEYQIIKGIEIKFYYPFKSIKIIAYSLDGNEIFLKPNYDFFIDSSACVFLSFEKIKEKKIHVIDVIAIDEKYIKRFMMADYINEIDGLDRQFK